MILKAGGGGTFVVSFLSQYYDLVMSGFRKARSLFYRIRNQIIDERDIFFREQFRH